VSNQKPGRCWPPGRKRERAPIGASLTFEDGPKGTACRLSHICSWELPFANWWRVCSAMRPRLPARPIFATNGGATIDEQNAASRVDGLATFHDAIELAISGSATLI